MVTQSIIPSSPTGRHQRRLRNYLLDSRFQLRYTGYMILIAFVVGGGLGFGLWRTGSRLATQSEQAVASGEQAVSLGKTVLAESQKVSAVVKMNIEKDPTYAADPALLAAFQADSAAQDATLGKQQEALENQARLLEAQAAELRAQRAQMLWMLPLVCVVLVLVIAMMGIYVTHKVAGPIYKMKRQLADVGAGYLRIPQPLRKGDELVAFFETFDTMVRNLRRRQEVEIEKLDRALVGLEAKVAQDHLIELRRLRTEMQAALDV
ncbi:MAG: HAMP domain-containing protein [Polyangiaceae bacterium]|nr:HAMP domain-containing protein [Polyangiaceae bacterium]